MIDTDKVQSDMDWLSGLPSRFAGHRSLTRFRDLLSRVAAASDYDPGETDLDDEQPARTVEVDLGDVRLARRLLR